MHCMPKLQRKVHSALLHELKTHPHTHRLSPATVFLGKLERRELLLTAFQHFDKDGSGFITEQELVEALREHHMPEEQLQELLGEVDRDGDNNIDYDEVRRMGSRAAEGRAEGRAHVGLVEGLLRQVSPALWKQEANLRRLGI